jgi:hypothetical protein
MAKRRGRAKKAGPRTKSGRLSRAYQGPARDAGTAELQAKRLAAINGADPQLAASASGILLANSLISEDQHLACLRYAHAHALVYGKVWTVKCPLAWQLPVHGPEPAETSVVAARKRIDAWNARLDPDQRQAVANVSVFSFLPQWFVTLRLKLRPLPSDERERQALLSGLDAIAR